MRKIAFAAALACGGMLAVPAVASASPTSGTEHFHLVSTSINGPGVILAHGVFNAGGTDYQGQPNDLAVFSTGAFTIHHPGGTSTITTNPRTCVAKLLVTGSYTLLHGYGAYKGLHGSGTYVLHGTLTAPRSANGTCNFRAQPTAVLQVIDASGPVSFS